MAAAKALETDDVAAKLLKVRDKYISHLEMTPLGAEPAPFDVGSVGLVYNDVLSFPERFRAPVFELVRVTTGSVYDKDA